MPAAMLLDNLPAIEHARPLSAFDLASNHQAKCKNHGIMYLFMCCLPRLPALGFLDGKPQGRRSKPRYLPMYQL